MRNVVGYIASPARLRDDGAGHARLAACARDENPVLTASPSLRLPASLMTDAHYTTLPLWPRAHPVSGASAMLKRHNEDFIVTELPLQLPSGEGEHLWLDVEKNGANTAFVA